jgi:uncharacterized membrane protein YraQ (UPF0718 family)
MEPISIKMSEPPPTVGLAAKEPIDYPTLAFLLAALWFIPVGDSTGTLGAFRVVFVSIVLEAIPFMLVGSLASGLIEVFVSRERMTALLPRNGWLTVCAAAGAGILFPVCECAVVPVVRRLIGKGLPLSAAVGYLLGGPIVNPIVAVSTTLAYALNWRLAALRLVLGYAIAVAVGLLMGRLFKKESALATGARPADFGAACGCGHPHGHPAGVCGCADPAAAPAPDWLDRCGAALRHAADDFMAVGHYLVIGAFIAALAQTFVPRANFVDMAGYPLLAVAAMMALAVLLNLCSEADAFIAASFRGLVPLAGQMAFMLTGPMLDLKLLLMYRGLFRTRAIFCLALLVLGAVSAVSAALAWVFAGVTL